MLKSINNEREKIASHFSPPQHHTFVYETPISFENFCVSFYYGFVDFFFTIKVNIKKIKTKLKIQKEQMPLRFHLYWVLNIKDDILITFFILLQIKVPLGPIQDVFSSEHGFCWSLVWRRCRFQAESQWYCHRSGLLVSCD